MNQNQTRICFVCVFSLFFCVVFCKAEVQTEPSPLNKISREQRVYLEIRRKAIEEQRKGTVSTREDILKRVYSPVVLWCRQTAPKFAYEAMKAGDKSKTVTNVKKQNEWRNISALYVAMEDCCKKVVSFYEKRNYTEVRSEINKYILSEKEALSKRYQLPRRTWLSDEECNNLFWALNASRRSEVKRKKLNATINSQESKSHVMSPNQGNRSKSRPTKRYRRIDNK